MVYIWKTNFDEVDEQLGITPKSSTKESKVKYSIETPVEHEEENEQPRGILKEKSANVKESSSSQDSELSKLNSKMDMIMKTLVLMDKRLSLVEDQLRTNQRNEWKIKGLYYNLNFRAHDWHTYCSFIRIMNLPKNQK